MSDISQELEYFIHLAKAKTVTARRFDNRLSFRGIGFSDFMILHHISSAPDSRMRRTDLAERVGLTPSGITRLLLPMEKIGLVKREASDHDARVSYVSLAQGGKRLYEESLVDAELLSQDLLSGEKKKDAARSISLLDVLGKTVVY